MEQLETGRVRLHKYVDVESIEQPVHLFHEEYEIERIPISAEDQGRSAPTSPKASWNSSCTKSAPYSARRTCRCERVRLRARRVEEDTTVRDQVRRERIEIEPDRHSLPPGVLTRACRAASAER